MSNKLEVIEREAAEELDQLKVRITDYDREFHSAFQRQMGFAFLAGAALMRAKEIVPHGKFMQWREAEIEVKRSSAERYMKFTEALQAKFPTVGNMKEFKILGEGEALTAEQQDRITEAVHELADGKTLTEMYRDLGVIRQPKKHQHHPRKMTDEQIVEAEIAHANDTLDHIAGLIRSVLAVDDKTIMIGDKVRCKVLDDLRIDLGKALAEKLKGRNGGAK